MNQDLPVDLKEFNALPFHCSDALAAAEPPNPLVHPSEIGETGIARLAKLPIRTTSGSCVPFDALRTRETVGFSRSTETGQELGATAPEEP